uniref:RNase H type-1 domain-containing protein n=1 Tax=Fagus sylvatica TaxID=28930 RepID=A0A2N9GGG6_FAGSY
MQPQDRLQIKSKNLILTIARHEISRFLIEADCLGSLGKDSFYMADLIQLYDPLMVEANAALLAARKATEMGFQSVIVEGDSLKVIQAIQARWALSSNLAWELSQSPPFLLLFSWIGLKGLVPLLLRAFSTVSFFGL